MVNERENGNIEKASEIKDEVCFRIEKILKGRKIE